MKSANFKLKTPSVKNSPRKRIVILLVVLLLVTGAGLVTFLKVRSDNNRTAAEQKARDEAQTGNAKASRAKSEKEGATTGQNLPNNSDTSTTDQIPSSGTMSLEISQLEQSGDTINVTAKASGSDKEGTCVLTFSLPDEKPVVKQVNSVGMSCSLSISKLEFSRLGNWNLNAVFYQGESKTEANRVISIQ